jgi:hypothetical protein
MVSRAAPAGLRHILPAGTRRARRCACRQGLRAGAGPNHSRSPTVSAGTRTRVRSRRAATGRRAGGPVRGWRRTGRAPRRGRRPSAGLGRSPPPGPLPPALGRARAGRPRRQCWPPRRHTTIRPCPATQNAGPAENQHMRPGSCVQPSPRPEPGPEAPCPRSAQWRMLAPKEPVLRRNELTGDRRGSWNRCTSLRGHSHKLSR